MTKKSALAALSLLGLAIAGCNSNSAGGGTGSATAGGASLDTSAVVAKVGTEDISRGEIFTFLEANAGEAALRQLLDYHLVMQEAKAKGIEVPEAELEAEVTKRQETNPTIAELVKSKSPRLEAYKQQLRSQIAVERLMTRDVKADPAAVEKWLASNDPTDPTKKAKTRARYDKAEQVKIGILLTSQKARADVMASQLKGSKGFSALVDEQKKAQDPVAQGSTASTADAAGGGGAGGGYLPITQLPPPVAAALTKVQVNGTTPVLTLSKPAGKSAGGVFGIVQLLDRRAASKAKASDPDVVADYKLTQVALKTLKASPNKVTLDQAVQQIMQQQMQQAMQTGNFSQPTYRQAIDQINQGEITAMLQKLRTSATSNVSIPDKQYESVLTAYKPLATPAPAASGAPATGAPGSAPAAGAPAAGAPGSAPAAGAPAAGSAPAAR